MAEDAVWLSHSFQDTKALETKRNLISFLRSIFLISFSFLKIFRNSHQEEHAWSSLFFITRENQNMELIFLKFYIFFLKKLKIWKKSKKKYGKVSLFRLFMAFIQILLKYGKIVWRHGNMAFELLCSLRCTQRGAKIKMILLL
jgi:hypothetical protein